MVGSLDADSPNGLPLASFWECREYQRTVKRVESSYKLCNELSLMIQERAELEKAYSVNLKRWSARWLSFLDSGLEYGTGALAWKGLCREAETISNAHQSVRNLLIDEIQTGLKHWQKEHFHKTPLPPQTLKESKLFEQDFEQAQKPWAKRLKKMTQCKKDFHQACKMERSLQVQVQNAKTDPSGTPEQQADEDRKLKKIQEKLKKAEKEVERAQFVYNNALDDLRSESPRYLEEMTKVFNRTQDFERERLVYFKDVFSNLHKALDVTQRTDFKAVYSDLEQSIAHCDIEVDLAWWSTHHGVDMPAVLPEFEEYSPELTTISNKKRSQVSETNTGVTLTGITPVISSPAQISPNRHSEQSVKKSTNGPQATLPTPFDDFSPTSDSKSFEQTTEPPRSALPVAPSTVAEVPTADELSDADYYASATFDDGRPGVPVRALYDYTSQEDDELTFVAGDIFEKLEDADDQGWCKGRKDGRAGLYPANYAEPI